MMSIRVSKCVDPDPDQHSVVPDLGPSCLPKYQQSAKVATSR